MTREDKTNRMKQSKQIFIICDRNVRAYAEQLAPDAPIMEIIADEAHKNIESVLAMCRWLLSKGAGRSAIVYAVGGGVTTDMVGFAASIYKRGVSYINYPTTLLSQVDAGIGGKTGVNLDGYKNMLGLTRFPRDTRIIPGVLSTLPERELRSGAAELIKTFIIEDKGRYERTINLLSQSQWDFDALAPLIKEAADVKRRIVHKDPYEEGLRRVLNLGHSYGHAIEWWQSHQPTDCQNQKSAEPQNHKTTSQQSSPTTDCQTPPLLSHGEAVAIGIIKAAKISEALGIGQRGLSRKFSEDFCRCGLPTVLPCSEEILLDAMRNDKKVENGVIHFVLPKSIGKVVIEPLNQIPKTI